MSHNQNNDIMKPTDYIEWDNLKNIPFFLCQVVEDKADYCSYSYVEFQLWKNS